MLLWESVMSGSDVHWVHPLSNSGTQIKPGSNIEDDFAIEIWLNTIRSFPYFLCLDSAHFSWIDMIDLVLDIWMKNKNSKVPRPDGSIHNLPKYCEYSQSIHGNLRIPPKEIAVHITGCISTMHQISLTRKVLRSNFSHFTPDNLLEAMKNILVI